MPIYEYQCRDCGKHIEKRQSISDAPLTVCEECGGKLEKQWSLSGFQFKGSGWYLTDYSSKGKDGAAKSDTKTESKDETKTDSAASDNTTSKTSETTEATKTVSSSKE